MYWPRCFFVIACACGPLCNSALGAEPASVKPAWSLETKGGRFTPDLAQWSDYYGSDYTEHLAFSLSWKLLRMLEVGMEGQRMRAVGVGVLPLNGVSGERVAYQLYPLQIGATFRAIFHEEQLVVPYLGGGWARVYYDIEIAGQDDTKGSVDGQFLRAGLQILLDPLDRSDAANLRLYGIDNTYWFIEAEQLTARDKTADVDIGGESWLTGLLFEF